MKWKDLWCSLESLLDDKIDWWYIKNGLFSDFRGVWLGVIFLKYGCMNRMIISIIKIIKIIKIKIKININININNFIIYIYYLKRILKIFGIIGIIGCWIIINDYIHHIFHRQWPPKFKKFQHIKYWYNFIRIYYHIGKLVYPLTILWRLCTCWLRVYPNVVILGGTRCGTTTLTHYLLELPFCKGPFTPLLMPELSGKECYYMIGDYFRGFIHPYFYKMCFPTIFTIWYYQWKYQCKPIVIDSTPLYLVNSVYTSPLFQRLQQYQQKQYKSNFSPIKFIVSVREPIQQNLSWFAFCSRAQDWGTNAGLDDLSECRDDEIHSAPYHVNYPFRTFMDAFTFSQGEYVTGLFRQLEEINWNECNFIPEWARFAPNGDMSVLSQMGRYVEHLEKFEEIFGRENIHVINFEEISDDIEKVWMDLCKFLEIECNDITMAPIRKDIPLHMNIGPHLSDYNVPTDQDLIEIAKYYKPWNERLFQWLNKDLGWHQQKWYYNSSTTTTTTTTRTTTTLNSE